MTKVVKDEKLRAELREKGLQRVQNFSWHKCAAETLQVIEKL
jgi:glycosyltransferase involved in cell wall biosynthesis